MTSTESYSLKRALISVSDKTNIVALAKTLAALEIEILSTGGTAKTLRDAGIKITEVSEYTGFPEIMDGRVKTLHPKIHGGLLGRRGKDDAVMQQQDISPIDLLILNLYPFAQTIAKLDVSLEEAIENIDIGGPAMLRAGAKNYNDVAVLTNPEQYAAFSEELTKNKRISAKTRFNLAVAAFNHVACYDAMISDYLSSLKDDGNRQAFPNQSNSNFIKVMDLRYGENPHQQAAFYKDLSPVPGTLATFRQLQGKELSYNNIADADTAWECVRQFTAPACVIVKHANPCGVAIAENLHDAYQKAFSTDPVSAFGGIIAFNRPPDQLTVEILLNQQFVEVLIAPQIDKKLQELLATKKNIRVLEIPMEDSHNLHDIKRIGGGLLIQTADTYKLSKNELKNVSSRQPTESELADLLFAWQVAKFVKSNAIVYAKNNHTVGIGAGQMSRIDSARIASLKAQDAKLEVTGSVMASDAFFPFRDGIDHAATLGVTAIIQPGGSIRDDEVIAATNEAGIAMVFTGIRHFRH